MGVFDFFKDVGSSVFGGDDEGESIVNMLTEELGDKVRDITAEVADGVVKLGGTCDSLPTKEKAVLLSGNVEGVEQVDDGGLEVASDAPEGGEMAPEGGELIETEESQFYQIESGDTLSKIAKEFYGSANKYPLIFEANREVIKDPDKIYPGQKIRIPKLAG